jgi:hypothetical protein
VQARRKPGVVPETRTQAQNQCAGPLSLLRGVGGVSSLSHACNASQIHPTVETHSLAPRHTRKSPNRPLFPKVASKSADPRPLPLGFPRTGHALPWPPAGAQALDMHARASETAGMSLRAHVRA